MCRPSAFSTRTGTSSIMSGKIQSDAVAALGLLSHPIVGMVHVNSAEPKSMFAISEIVLPHASPLARVCYASNRPEANRESGCRWNFSAQRQGHEKSPIGQCDSPITCRRRQSGACSLAHHPGSSLRATPIHNGRRPSMTSMMKLAARS